MNLQLVVSRLSGPSSSPGWGLYVVFLVKTHTLLSQCLSPNVNGTGKFNQACNDIQVVSNPGLVEGWARGRWLGL